MMKYVRYNVITFVVIILLSLFLLHLGLIGGYTRNKIFEYSSDYDYYRGVVVNQDKAPLVNVDVALEIDGLTTVVKTDSRGYFIMDDSLSRSLVVMEKYKVLVVDVEGKIFRIETQEERKHGTQKTYTYRPYFNRKQMDTIILDLEHNKYEMRW